MPAKYDPDPPEPDQEFDYWQSLHCLSPSEELIIFADLTPYGDNEYDGVLFHE